MSKRESRHSAARTEPPAASRSIDEPAAATPPSFMRLRLPWASPAAAVLLVLHFLLAVTSDARNSTIFDEVVHVPKAAAIHLFNDFRLDPTHGPLVHWWAGLPLRYLGLKFPERTTVEWRGSDAWSIGHQLFNWKKYDNDTPRILWWTRAMIALLSVACGAVVFCWSRELFGDAGGLLSLLLFAFDPTMLAHGTVVTTDLASGLFFLLAMWRLWHVSGRLTLWNLATATLATAALLLAKFAGALIVVMGAMLIAARLFDRSPLMVRLPGLSRDLHGRGARTVMLGAECAAIIFGSAVMIWAAFSFRWSPYDGGPRNAAEYERLAAAGEFDYYFPAAKPKGGTRWQQVLEGGGIEASVAGFVHRHGLLPDAYVYGYMALRRTLGARDAFLNGERSPTGWWYFFPYAFLVKTPLPLLGVLAIAAVAGIGGLVRGRQLSSSPPVSKGGKGGFANVSAKPQSDASAAIFNPAGLGAAAPRGATLPLWVLIIVYGGSSIASTVNIGHRHILPIYPPLLVLAGGAGAWLLASWWKRITLLLCAGCIIPASWIVYPFYLSNFNSLVGGSKNGWRHLVDSSLDWGQDLNYWVEWARTKIDAGATREPVYFHFFGKEAPRRKGVPYRDIIEQLPADLLSTGLTAGWYCISATSFAQLSIYGASEHRTGVPLATDWRPEHERLYQSLRPAMAEFEQLPHDRTARQNWLRNWRPTDHQAVYDLYQKLRFTRICGHLRRRGPDEWIGYSILVFNVTDDQIRAYIDGPPP